MASTTKIIDPDNGAGTDYTSLAAWEAWASTQGTSGDTHTAQCRSSSGTADTSVSIYAWVSGVEYRIEVLSGYRHNAIPGGTNVYKLQVADYGYGITITSISGTVDGVEIISGGTQSRQPIRVSYGGTQIFENMLVQGAGANYASFQSTYGTGYRTVRNCIFYARNASATCIEGASSSTSTIAVENCTIVGYMNGVLELSGTVTCSNVGVSGATTAFGSGVATTTCSSTTPSFVDAAIDDYHLDAADTAWRGAGTDLSATFTTDIDGDTRSSWDIGADEYAAGGGGTLALSGTLAAVASLAGGLDVSADLAGGVVGAAALTGDVAQAAALAGTVAGASTLAGALDRSATLAGGLAATTALTGDAGQAATLGGTVAGTATLGGDADQAATLAGPVHVVVTLTGDVTASTPGSLAGAIAITSTLAGDAAMAADLAGDLAAAGALTGGLDLAATLAGGVVGVTVMGADAASAQTLDAALDAVATLAGDLSITYGTELAGTISAVVTLTGDLSTTEITVYYTDPTLRSVTVTRDLRSVTTARTLHQH